MFVVAKSAGHLLTNYITVTLSGAAAVLSGAKEGDINTEVRTTKSAGISYSNALIRSLDTKVTESRN